MKRNHLIIAGAILAGAWLYRRHRQNQAAAQNNISSVMASRL